MKKTSSERTFKRRKILLEKMIHLKETDFLCQKKTLRDEIIGSNPQDLELILWESPKLQDCKQMLV